MTENTLQPIEQRQVNFYGDELTAVRADLVPMSLTGIRVASVKEEQREKLTTFNVSRVRAAPKTPHRRIVLIELSRTPNANLYRDFRGL